MSASNYDEQCRAIRLLRSGSSAQQVADGLGHRLAWVYKWRRRYEQGGWEALREQSRRPKHPPS